MIRYIWATIWMSIILCFSYGELILNFFINNDVGFNKKLYEMHKSDGIMLANIGLIVLLFIDKYINQLISKREYLFRAIDILLLMNILIATLLTLFARKVNEAEFVNWFELSYLFLIFVVVLIVYKAESMKTSHFASDKDILPSKNIQLS